MGWIGATMGLTLAVRRPFTLGIARRKAPREVWNSPHFLRMNTVITAVWAGSFAAAAVAIALCVASGVGTVAPAGCQVLGFVIPAVFTHRYPTIVRNHLADPAGTTTATAL